MLIMLFVPFTVRADHIYSIDMDIDIDKFGNANVTEVWDVKADSGSEWYKTMYDLDGSEISNYVVFMDENQMQFDSSWNVEGTISEKKGYYGINNTIDGMELCFGKGDMNRHKFIVKYTLSNYIFNTDDSQVLYWTLIPNITLDHFTVDVTSYYTFPDTLDVWGYGYKGYAYVKDGKISMSEESSLNNQDVVLLAKFPLNTFDTVFRINRYNDFDDVYNDADKDSFEYDYSDYSDDYGLGTFITWIFFIFSVLFPWVCFLIVTFVSMKRKIENNGYGYVNNKKIDKKNVPMFRDIPCDKNIFYANVLIKLNNFGYNKFNILGAIILKWVKEGKIKFNNLDGGIFERDTSVIDLTLNPKFDNYVESQLFGMMYKASNDGKLEAKEFEKWVKNNYDGFLELFSYIEEEMINFLKVKFHIYHRITKKECNYKNVMSDRLYSDSIELYGLKKYLEEFSRMDTKEVMEVKFWDEYLMFAYLFGIADKVSKQLKDMYPEVLQYSNFDYDMIEFVDSVSNKIVRYAGSFDAKISEDFRESARSAARTYSFGGSGGGGFSRGGGGGGSRGGGSRGSAGGR